MEEYRLIATPILAFVRDTAPSLPRYRLLCAEPL
jgi:hypothetical protein